LDQKVLFGGTRIPSVVQSQEGITVSIEEFASVNKSKQAFDSDVISSGVLPLLFRIDSKSDAVFKIPPAAIKVYLDNQALAVLDAETAAKQAATRDYFGKALGWTILAGPFAVHGHEVIEPPGSVEAECFGKASSIHDFIEFESLLANVESKAHEAH